MTDHGHVHWNELMTRSAAKAKDFYGKALGWTFDDMPMPGGTYTIINANGKMVGGMMEMMPGPMFDDVPEHWFTYFAVDELDNRLAKAKAMGAKVMREPFDVPGVGRIAIITDPAGVAQGWMVPAPSAAS